MLAYMFCKVENLRSIKRLQIGASLRRTSTPRFEAVLLTAGSELTDYIISLHSLSHSFAGGGFFYCIRNIYCNSASTVGILV